MSKKWYNYFVSVDDAAGAEQSPPDARNVPPLPRVPLRAWPRSHPA